MVNFINVYVCICDCVKDNCGDVDDDDDDNDDNDDDDDYGNDQQRRRRLRWFSWFLFSLLLFFSFENGKTRQKVFIKRSGIRVCIIVYFYVVHTYTIYNMFVCYILNAFRQKWECITAYRYAQIFLFIGMYFGIFLKGNCCWKIFPILFFFLYIIV